jgi:hypothetical protein
MPMDKEEIKGHVNVLEGDLADFEIALPCAEWHDVAPSASPEPDGSLSHPEEQTTCRRGTETRHAGSSAGLAERFGAFMSP